MIRSTFGTGRYVAAEDDFVTGTIHSWTGSQPNGIVFCHGSSDTAAIVSNDATQRALVNRLGRHATVHVGDLGFQTFGNTTGITRVGQAIAYERASWGQSGPVVLVGISMGALTALTYALAHPTEVAAVACVIPALDLADIYSLGVPFSTFINTAYGGAYNDATDGPTHSPVQFADDLPADMPIALWTSSDDTLARPPTATAFVNARPQTARTNLGALGHTGSAIAAASDAVVEFVEQFTYPGA